jgi:hypothetical protein
MRCCRSFAKRPVNLEQGSVTQHRNGLFASTLHKVRPDRLLIEEQSLQNAVPGLRFSAALAERCADTVLKLNQQKLSAPISLPLAV